jgi:CHRD domain
MKRWFLAALTVLPVALVTAVTVAQGQRTPSRASGAPAKLTICVKSAAGTFRRITVSSRAVTNPSSAAGKTLRAHLLRTGDAIVVGTGACPSPSATPSPTSTPPAKITICHKTGSATNPFRRITVSSRAVTNPNSASGKILRGHMRHTGDILMPGANACPAGTKPSPGIKLTADLRPVPPATTGSGSATVTIRVGQGQLSFTLTVSGLTNVTAAHIHRASTGDIVVPLTAPTTGSSSGTVSVSKTLLQEIVGNPSGFYVNVHTMSFPDGQIRGTLTK